MASVMHERKLSSSKRHALKRVAQLTGFGMQVLLHAEEFFQRGAKRVCHESP